MPFFAAGRRSLHIAIAAVLLHACTQKVQQEQRSPADTPPLPSFDAEHAYQLIERQVAFGARVPGSRAHLECRDFLLETLKQYADTAFLQGFEQRVYGQSLRLWNICASFQREHPERILLCAHWDSRPYADEEENPALQRLPVPGANDGASGVAVLLELARIFSASPPPVGVDILLVDGEDYGRAGDVEHFLLGSRYAARNYPFPRLPRWGAVVDLVGDRQARFPMEDQSLQAAPQLVARLWEIGQRLFPQYFVPAPAGAIIDDHLPFIERGIPMALIIDAELVGNRSPIARKHYWHTTRDLPDNIGQETLRAVGTVLLEWLYRSPLP